MTLGFIAILMRLEGYGLAWTVIIFLVVINLAKIQLKNG